MSGQILFGTAMIVVTIVVHTLGLGSLVFLLRNRQMWTERLHIYIRIMDMLVIAIVGIFVLHTIEIWLWASLYVYLGEFENLQGALYFSTVTFTTLGYGDVILQPHWRLLSSLEAANGIILTGVSTAFAYAAMRKAFEVTGVLEADR